MPRDIKGGGGLRHGHNPKKGGLRHEPKKGVSGTGRTRKKEGIKNWSCEKTILVTNVAQRRVLGAYLLMTFTFFLST